ELLFCDGQTGVEPRRTLSNARSSGAASARQIRIGLVGPPQEIKFARLWLPRLNAVAVAREKSARRYRDWPGAQRAFGATFVVDDRFVRPLDQDRLNLSFSRPSPG